MHLESRYDGDQCTDFVNCALGERGKVSSYHSQVGKPAAGSICSLQGGKSGDGMGQYVQVHAPLVVKSSGNTLVDTLGGCEGRTGVHL